MATPQLATRRVARAAQFETGSGSGWYATIARVGLVAKGVAYGLVGVLALDLAFGGGGRATSQTGALQTLGRHGFGRVAIILLALGFASYALWRLVQAFAEKEDGAEGWLKRAVCLGRAVIYSGFTYSAVKILLGSRNQSQNGKAHHATAVVLGWPGGTWIVGIAGAVIVCAGLVNAYHGLTRKFEEQWRGRHKWSARAGVVGHLARAVVFALIGAFVVKAAIEYDPKAAIGLDGALQKLAHASYGPYLLGVTAAGLVCYGLYCFVDARYRDISLRSSGY